jgi:DNA-binding response OmpR family regulator
LITDVVMPRVSGRELMRQFVELRPHSKVLVMSGYTDNVIDRHDLIDTGAAYLEKPFGPDALAKKVRQLLDGREGEG